MNNADKDNKNNHIGGQTYLDNVWGIDKNTPPASVRVDKFAFFFGAQFEISDFVLCHIVRLENIPVPLPVKKRTFLGNFFRFLFVAICIIILLHILNAILSGPTESLTVVNLLFVLAYFASWVLVTLYLFRIIRRPLPQIWDVITKFKVCILLKNGHVLFQEFDNVQDAGHVRGIISKVCAGEAFTNDFIELPSMVAEPYMPVFNRHFVATALLEPLNLIEYALSGHWYDGTFIPALKNPFSGISRIKVLSATNSGFFEWHRGPVFPSEQARGEYERCLSIIAEGKPGVDR